jgi:Flp pilus assembly protein TadB
MLKKLLSAFLAFMILTVASSASVFARAIDSNEKTGVAKEEKQIEKRDLSSVLKTKNDSVNTTFTKKDTLAAYEKEKAQGRKFSATTKVLIGVGIAAAVVAIVAVAASNGAKDAGSF